MNERRYPIFYCGQCHEDVESVMRIHDTLMPLDCMMIFIEFVCPHDRTHVLYTTDVMINPYGVDHDQSWYSHRQSQFRQVN